MALGMLSGFVVLFAGGYALKVQSRPLLRAVPSTVRASISRQACIDCHAPIAAEWRQSFHFRSLTGAPWAEIRQLGYLKLFTMLRKPCVTRHAPANVLDLASSDGRGSAMLGVECTPNLFRDAPGLMPAARTDDVELGVDCTAPHVSKLGVVGAGRRHSAQHETNADRRFQDGTQTSVALCKTCHGSIVEAWTKTAFAAKGVTCLECPMPTVQAASVVDGPPRERRSHQFNADKDSLTLIWAVNAAVELVGNRRMLLRISNDHVGHYLPSGGNRLTARLTAYDTGGKLIKTQVAVFGRDEAVLLDFWPFTPADTRIPSSERREVPFDLPDGHGRVDVAIKYHDWMGRGRVIRTLSEAY